jgi:hypothetical protein
MTMNDKKGAKPDGFCPFFLFAFFAVAGLHLQTH